MGNVEGIRPARGDDWSKPTFQWLLFLCEQNIGLTNPQNFDASGNLT
jgi:hypothetical protein